MKTSNQPTHLISFTGSYFNVCLVHSDSFSLPVIDLYILYIYTVSSGKRNLFCLSVVFITVYGAVMGTVLHQWMCILDMVQDPMVCSVNFLSSHDDHYHHGHNNYCHNQQNQHNHNSSNDSTVVTTAFL